MNFSLPQPDWELLSAYMDHQMDERQERAIEARLAEEASLQQALARLQRTRALLRRAPQRRAPRSFVLHPEMVASKRAPGFRWPFSLSTVSAVATILFALVLLSDFALYGVPLALLRGAPAPAAEALEEPMALQAPAEADAGEEALEPPRESPEGTPLPSEDEELQLFAAQEEAQDLAEEASREMQAEGPDFQAILRWAEIGLGALAIVTGLEAGRRKRARN